MDSAPPARHIVKMTIKAKTTRLTFGDRIETGAPDDEAPGTRAPRGTPQPVPEPTPTETRSGAPGDRPERVEQPPGEIGGSDRPEPTRYGDWEVGGRCTDF